MPSFHAKRMKHLFTPCPTRKAWNVFGPNGAAGCSHAWRRGGAAARSATRGSVPLFLDGRGWPGGPGEGVIPNGAEESKNLLRPAGAKEDKEKRTKEIRFPRVGRRAALRPCTPGGFSHDWACEIFFRNPGRHEEKIMAPKCLVHKDFCPSPPPKKKSLSLSSFYA